MATKDEGMEKYGVKLDLGEKVKVSEQLTVKAACPRCKAELDSVDPPHCPNCGTEPWEARK